MWKVWKDEHGDRTAVWRRVFQRMLETGPGPNLDKREKGNGHGEETTNR